KVPPIVRSRSGLRARARSDMRSSAAALLNKVCGMIAGERSFRARTHILQNEGPRADVAFVPRRVPSRSRAPANSEWVGEARTAARLRRSGKVRSIDWRRDVRPPSDSGK